MSKPTGQCAAVIDDARCPEQTRVMTWCRYHWRQQKDGRPFTTWTARRPRGSAARRDGQGRKQCARCMEWRRVDDYRPAAGAPDGLQSWCSPCAGDYALMARYGITRRDVLEMVTAQGGCGICGALEPRAMGFRNGWHVDHDHACCPTDKTCGECVRGILCADCNKLIGLALDSVTRLQQAAQYLRDCEAKRERVPQAHVGQQAASA